MTAKSLTMALVLLLYGCGDRATTPLDAALDASAEAGSDSAGKDPCKPYCGAIGSRSEGWFDGCKDALLDHPSTGSPFWDNCETCEALCKSEGAEGWYSSCDDALIREADCS